MAFDGFVVHALANEFIQKLQGARVDKIQQPLPKDLVLTLRANGQNFKLLFSVNPSLPRIYLDDSLSIDNPAEAPMFCMLLRKLLEGGRLTKIEQVGNDRVLRFRFETRNELGDLEDRLLLFELMGKHTNLIVIDPNSGRIFDSMVHVNRTTSSYREILPGRTYLSPPPQHKKNPFEVSFETLWNAREETPDIPFAKFLLAEIEGMSPVLAKEITARALESGSEKDILNEILLQFKRNEFQPTGVKNTEGQWIGFSILPLTYLNGISVKADSISEMLAKFYSEKAIQDVVSQKAGDLERFVEAEKQKNVQKLLLFQQMKNEAKTAETWRIYGELLTSSLHELSKGLSSITLSNFYSEEGELAEIPLVPELSPIENAQLYFRKYGKAKKSIPAILEQERICREEIEYLDGILVQLKTATWQDIEQIREELTTEGYLKRARGKRMLSTKKSGNKKISKASFKVSLAKPSKFLSSDGTEIWVGKNNRQNDALTFKLSNPWDTWLHTKDIPGSHVLIRGRDLSERTLLEAAELAAYFSKARDSANVPVDYTSVKNVWKPNGAKPGFVLYEKGKTLFVTPRLLT